MMFDPAILLATFTAPENIGTTPQSMLWMFPLLASIAIIYKATKIRVLLWGGFFRSAIILFCTLSVFMVLSAVLLNIIVWFVTG